MKNIIEQKRKERGMTQQQLAAALLAILVFDQVLVGQVLCGLTCLQGLLYTILYWHYGRKY